MADYWEHWLAMGKTKGAKLPKIFYVNWFRKNGQGKFMWPGFGDNSRVLKWVFERCEGTAEAVETPIGNLPTLDAIDFDGLDMDEADKVQLLKVDINGWLQEIPLINEYYDQFGDRLPAELREEVRKLQKQLESAKQAAA
jgi:phosphoenolpyruvate carboxykinase (GTP)